jgi:hypothetical protein
MVNLKKILNEDVGSIWSPRQYQASSMAPRKDQGPLFSQKDGKNFPYQQNSPPVFPPNLPQPEAPETMPWPLENINSDLADGFVFILAAAKKISQCEKQNKKLTNKQREHLFSNFKMLIKITKAIQKVGMELPNVVNMASNVDSPIPMEPYQSPYIPSTTTSTSRDTANIQPQKL